MVNWPDDLLTQRQAAKILKISIISLWRLRPENNKSINPSLEYTRHNSRIWYSKADLADYMRKCKNRHRRQRSQPEQSV